MIELTHAQLWPVRTVCDCGTDLCQWHGQARLLAQRLPIDVVRIIGKYVQDNSATVLQKWVRGACVRLAWDMPGLCDSDGNLVVYGQHGCRLSFPIFHNLPLDLTLDEMEEVD